jgi:signal transduction histidine kinase
MIAVVGAPCRSCERAGFILVSEDGMWCGLDAGVMISSMTAARERIGMLDIAIAVVISAIGVLYVWQQAGTDSRDVSAVAAPFAVAITLPVLWRRAAPVLAVAAALVALVIHAAFFSGGGLVTCLFTIPLLFMFAFAAGARLPVVDARIGLGVSLAFGIAICLTDGPQGATPETVVFVAPITLAIWGVGRLVRSRSQMAAELEARSNELRAARDERARLEVATDRARLSAQLDELLRRRLAELGRLADAGASETDPHAMTKALARIEQASRSTLEEMRTVVGVLRGGETQAPREPQPALTHLDALLLRAKDGARLEVDGNPRALPPGVELSAYRVVEHLLDALDDAPGVRVRIRYSDDAIELTVSGPARRHANSAIERARERVKLHNGTLDATTHGGHAEAIASLPVYVAA